MTTQMDFFGKGVAIFLCNLTMNMAQPWLEAGYRVVLVDPQHPCTSNSGMVERIKGTILDAMPRLGEIIRRENVVFVFGFPPCTDVAVSGARWFEDKRKADPKFQEKAAIVAEQCRTVGILAGCAWGFENPVSVFSSIFGRPSHTFHPHHYTGYCEDDNYTKATCLWTGGASLCLTHSHCLVLESLTTGFTWHRLDQSAPTSEAPRRADLPGQRLNRTAPTARAWYWRPHDAHPHRVQAQSSDDRAQGTHPPLRSQELPRRV